MVEIFFFIFPRKLGLKLSSSKGKVKPGNNKKNILNGLMKCSPGLLSSK